jgi:hypothetical protein
MHFIVGYLKMSKTEIVLVRNGSIISERGIGKNLDVLPERDILPLLQTKFCCDFKYSFSIKILIIYSTMHVV